MVLSSNDTRILNKRIRQDGEMFVIPRKGVFKTATTKKLAFHCFHEDILFYWSTSNYYFKANK